MKVQITGKNPQGIEDLIRSLGFEIVTENPEAIISYGGDGTLLASERDYPGIPKLPIRDSRFCNKCPNHDDKTVLEALLQNKLELKEYKKLQTNINNKDLFALNDFVIRNEQTIHAIRFLCFVNENQQGNLLIGDGIVVSTPFGSTGYFKSITGGTFDEGFAIAFNNLTERQEPIYLKKNEAFGFKLIRGKAILTLDNSPEIFDVNENTTLEFKISDQTAKIYILETLRCPNCQVQR